MASKVKAQSEWGVGDSDIRITANHAYAKATQTTGYYEDVQISITVAEAKSLIAQLEMAIHYVDNINQQCADHDNMFRQG